ncbi:EF-P lysine aminoacylase EpmA [Fodinicurvata halophila]|uniref:EF-P lysine aminoacylase EpmA n=1 Tax=Fodinicurvata halophila TaxID=1419723 RepID=UPI00362ABD9F
MAVQHACTSCQLVASGYLRPAAPPPGQACRGPEHTAPLLLGAGFSGSGNTGPAGFPGLEPHLQAFETSLRTPAGQQATLYLHTSPEFACKKLLVAGEPRLFALARVFRNAERSELHHPEFTLLEWYRAHDTYERLMHDCEELLRAVASALGRTTMEHDGRQVDVFQPWDYLSVPEAFHRYAGIDLLATAPDPLAPNAALLASAARQQGIRTAEDDDWQAVFTRILLEKVEPHLGHAAPTILYDYPVSQAALSRPKPSDPRLAERFELYVAGVELANAFGELTDAAEQRRRFEADCAEKERIYGERYPIDEDFLAALDYGMPEAAGIALGVDRLVMLATGAGRIEEVLWAPVHADEGLQR